ncbi:MAG: transglycosylase SLT domain-containing protein [Arcobacteraceae bacterium]|nr:transglycosylase SLT domain-containing protein [Arcobacteraceae bacterium]
MIKKIFCLGLFASILNADVIKKEITLDFLQNNPRSQTKDFYIWQYLDQNINSDEAMLALSEAQRVDNKLFFRFAKKFGHDETYAVAQCMQADTKSLIEQNDDCIELGLSYSQALSLSYDELKTIAIKLQENYPIKSKALEILNSNLPFVKLVSTSSEVFFEVFNKTPTNFRYEKLNYRLPQVLIDKIQDKNEFNQTIKLIVTDTKLKNLQNSLIGIDDTKLNFQSSFYLALNVLLNKRDDELALKYLDNASKKAYFKIDKDMVVFWQYLVTKNDELLQSLASSWDINIYSLYAQEKLNIQPQNIDFDTKIESDITMPVITQFDWVKILLSLSTVDEEMLNTFENTLSNNELPHLVFLKHRYHQYQKSFFITPYEKYLESNTSNRKSLIYALARQESGFIPTSISSSFALGAMQIMPFLVNSLSKEFSEDIFLEDMFNIEINLKYANKHLDYLESKLNHPLYVFYAYNGGIGYTNREIIPLFKENLPYQPFMAMELISFDETKQYGKKVLANYYIYNNRISSEPKPINFLLETIK